MFKDIVIALNATYSAENVVSSVRFQDLRILSMRYTVYTTALLIHEQFWSYDWYCCVEMKVLTWRIALLI